MTTSLFDTDARAAFADSVERFVAERYDFDTHRRLSATPDGFGKAEWGEMADLGWTCLSLPADHGGLGGGAVETAIVMEGIGQGLLLEPYIATVVLCGYLIATCGSDAQKAALLPSIVSADMIVAFAHKDGDDAVAFGEGASGWELNGTKTLVLHGSCADQLIVSAVGDTGTKALFLVDADSPGVARQEYRLVDGRLIAEVQLSGVSAERLGDDGDANEVIAQALDRAVAACCAEAVGTMSALNEETLGYAKVRQQFGVSIGSFQVLQHKLVDMTIAEQEARSITLAACRALDAGHPQAGMLVSAAKVRTGRAGRLIGESAIQIHGGIGMTSELAVGARFKRLLAIESLFGDIDFHLDHIAAGGHSG